MAMGEIDIVEKGTERREKGNGDQLSGETSQNACKAMSKIFDEKHHKGLWRSW
jgi:hypothetical protein